MVLLELVTGREANSADEDMSLVEWVWQHFSEDEPIDEIFDPEIKEESHTDQMIMVYKVGIVCTRASPATRPSMKEVLYVLRGCCLDEDNGARKMVGDFDVLQLVGSAPYHYSCLKRNKMGEDED